MEHREEGTDGNTDRNTNTVTDRTDPGTGNTMAH